MLSLTRNWRTSSRLLWVGLGNSVLAVLVAANVALSATQSTNLITDKEIQMAQASAHRPGGGPHMGGAGPSTSGPSGGSGGPKGNAGKGGGESGTPSKPTPPVPGLPQIPDGNGGASLPTPVDLSLLAGPQALPQRRPLRNASVSVPQTGVTGYAGVFIP